LNCQIDEADLDGDGFANTVDNCVDDVSTNQLNSDEDPYGDVCDNCIFDNNIDQKDYDNDGVGDECDKDPDGDGYRQADGDCEPLDHEIYPDGNEVHYIYNSDVYANPPYSLTQE